MYANDVHGYVKHTGGKNPDGSVEPQLQVLVDRLRLGTEPKFRAQL
jgi:hypothetical protein